MRSSSPIVTPEFINASLFGDSFFTIAILSIIGIYAIFTGVLYYHWNTYSNNLGITTLTFIIYFSITIPLLIIIITTGLIL